MTNRKFYKLFEHHRMIHLGSIYLGQSARTRPLLTVGELLNAVKVVMKRTLRNHDLSWLSIHYLQEGTVSDTIRLGPPLESLVGKRSDENLLRVQSTRGMGEIGKSKTEM